MFTVRTPPTASVPLMLTTPLSAGKSATVPVLALLLPVFPE
jgi:hypothetical protein